MLTPSSAMLCSLVAIFSLLFLLQSDVESGARVHLIETSDECTALAFHPSTHILAYATADKGKHQVDVKLVSAVYLASTAAATSSASSSHSSSKGKHSHHSKPPQQASSGKSAPSSSSTSKSHNVSSSPMDTSK